MKRSLKKFQKASGLVKLIIIISIISLLLALLIIGIDPAKQLANTNNTKRSGDVIKILNAIHTYASEHQGLFPPELPHPGADALEIAKSGADLCHELVPTYLETLPTDPLGTNGGINTDCSDDYKTGYKISVGISDNSITISAPNTQPPIKSIISATR